MFLPIIFYILTIVKLFLFFTSIVQVLLHIINCNQNYGGFAMSDLAATNCGGVGCGCGGDNGGCNIICIILILLCCGCGDNGGCRNNGGFGNDCFLIILLLLCCGSNSNGGLGCGC